MPPSPTCNSASPPSKTLTMEQAYWGMKEFLDKILLQHKQKNSDYAGTETDGLANFRRTAERLNLSMPQVFMVLMEKHFQALENDSKNPNLVLNEGVEDRLFDVAAYCGLFYLALRENTLTQRKDW